MSDSIVMAQNVTTVSGTSVLGAEMNVYTVNVSANYDPSHIVSAINFNGFVLQGATTNVSIVSSDTSITLDSQGIGSTSFIVRCDNQDGTNSNLVQDFSAGFNVTSYSLSAGVSATDQRVQPGVVYDIPIRVTFLSGWHVWASEAEHARLYAVEGAF